MNNDVFQFQSAPYSVIQIQTISYQNIGIAKSRCVVQHCPRVCNAINYAYFFSFYPSFQEIWAKFEMSDTFRDADNNSKADIRNALETKTNSTSSGSTEIGATKIPDGGAEKIPGVVEAEMKERGQKYPNKSYCRLQPKLHLLPKNPPVKNRAMWELKHFTLLHTFKVDFSRQRRRILKEDQNEHNKTGLLEKGLEDLMEEEFPQLFEPGETTSHDAVAALDSLISKSKLTVEPMEQEVRVCKSSCMTEMVWLF